MLWHYPSFVLSYGALTVLSVWSHLVQSHRVSIDFSVNRSVGIHCAVFHANMEYSVDQDRPNSCYTKLNLSNTSQVKSKQGVVETKRTSLTEIIPFLALFRKCQNYWHLCQRHLDSGAKTSLFHKTLQEHVFSYYKALDR